MTRPNGTTDDLLLDMRGLTLDEYLRMQRYSRSFVEGHLLPMAAAIWSSTAEDIRAYPLFAFVRFFESHGLLQLWERPNWRTVAGGSRAYVGALLQDFAGQLRLSTPVARVVRDAAGVTVTARTGQVDQFDAILIATHADQALSMLDAPSAQERELLGAFSYTTNTAVLHADETYMPREVSNSLDAMAPENAPDGDCAYPHMNTASAADS